MLTRSIENAQRRVEGYHFDVRKQLLRFDNVVNDQRLLVYEHNDYSDQIFMESSSKSLAGCCRRLFLSIVIPRCPWMLGWLMSSSIF